MNIYFKIRRITFGMLLLASLSACKKGWLDVRNDQSKFVPQKLADLQGLLDNADIMNGNRYGSECPIPALGELSVDDYYIDPTQFASCTELERNTYVWARNIYNGNTFPDWGYAYRVVFYANFVLESLEDVPVDPGNAMAWHQAKGSALFFRAHQFYQMAQLFAGPYQAATASQDWGIPLRLSSDPNERTTRASLRETYVQIISDLEMAIPLLPVYPPGTVPLHKTRPSKPAAYAQLARTYLVMGAYDKALLYADSCLQLYPALMTYRQLSGTGSYPIPSYNEEVIFQAQLQATYRSILPPARLVDSLLVRSYDTADLRKQFFFKAAGSAYTFKGSYSKSSVCFAGIATDEIYFIRAECHARKGETDAAMRDLNRVLEKRWKVGFVPLTAGSSQDALSTVLKERRKELLFRGIRWTDLRRLNRDPQFALSITRVVDHQTYTLPAGDQRYVLPIPDHIIQFSGIPQNNR